MPVRARIKKGSIQLIPFPFTDLSKKKIRPCVVLAHEGDDLIVVFITSVKPKGARWIHIEPTKMNGIKQSSYIRYAKIATLDINISLGEIGMLESSLHRNVIAEITKFIKV